MIEIDGSQGEGGGQIFRTSLTLSMCLGKPVRIINIRSGRSKPGLLRQHLTCLKAAKAICDAEVLGEQLGSAEVEFRPGKVKSGEYHFAVGSAGSTSLVFQTVLLPLIFSEEKSEITLEGGTHNGFAPSFDYIETCFLPAIASIGYRVNVELLRYGFYPAGGGAWKAHIQPIEEQKQLVIVERGKVTKQEAIAISAKLPNHITERELSKVQLKLGWPKSELHQLLIDSAGPGNIVSLRVESENISECVEVIGEKNLSSERVAGYAIKSLRAYLDANVPVGEYLADQLLLPMVLGKGGRFSTLEPSQHLLTNIEVIKRFINIDIRATQQDQSRWLIEVPA